MRDRLLPAVLAAFVAVVTPVMKGPALAGEINSAKGAGSVLLAALGTDGTLTAAMMPGAGRDAQPAALPKPLSVSDAALYKRIFALQADGQWAAADRDLGHLSDDVLKGHVLAQRYLSGGYKPKYQELRAWMAEYSDLPQAEAIHTLATSKSIKGFGAIKAPVRGFLKGSGIDTSDEGANWEENAFFPDRGTAKARAVKARFRSLLRDGEPAKALALMTNADARTLDRLDIDEMKLVLASDHFSDGRDAEAAAWASQVAERSGDEIPAAHWVAGLAEWRQGKRERAARHFEEAAVRENGSPWMVAASAFWAARANLVTKRPEVVNHWLEIAATYPRTFYGLLARQALGYETLFSWETPPFTEADADLLTRVPGTRRALALLQLGNAQAAEEELRKSYPSATKAVRKSMLVLSQMSDMPSLAVRLGGITPGLLNDAAAYPLPRWTPKGGWQLDKALVYAFVRQESAFNPKAVSHMGASGLMQLMPATARAVGGGVQTKLNDPETNLALGQKYLTKLLSEEPVKGNLLMLAAAYNAGPGKLGQWLGRIRHNNDPLLFIEALPSRETRAFVQRVMSNYWIYRSRLGQPQTTLDSVAAGVWPLYEGMDQTIAPRRVGSR